ncbi:MAG: glycosyl transferase family 2, partial [Saprospiraceae bacterium]|nr:glycosyl transferase family 2 [Saprospiraceae bacterium]
IGSSSKDEPGELYTINIRYNIAQPGQRRNKRVFDLLICLTLLIGLPLWLITSSHRWTLLRNAGAVLLGRRTWVGYAQHTGDGALPPLPPGIFSHIDRLKGLKINEKAKERLDFLYAKDWNVWRDLEIITGQLLSISG